MGNITENKDLPQITSLSLQFYKTNEIKFVLAGLLMISKKRRKIISYIFVLLNPCLGFLPQNTDEYHNAIKQIAYYDEWKHHRGNFIFRLFLSLSILKS